ncbi:MAG: membrane integrity-associated transporter subunit PqiC [Desulfobacteraceae bacterium]|nr:membrane integrity-associated transporter subunit PqiC [Desulfobacteraceae bacterium]
MQILWLKYQWIFILILTGCILSGCIETHPITPTQFYLLNPAQYETNLISKKDHSDPLSQNKISLEIASLRLPQYLEKPQIVTRSSQNQLKMAEYHQWGGNLRKNMIRVIAQNMSQLLATPNVAMAPFRPSTPPDFRIEVEVMRFEPDERGQVHFSAQWRLVSGKDGNPLATRMLDLESPVPESPLDFDHTISLMVDLLGEFCLVIGKEILLHIPGNPV